MNLLIVIQVNLSIDLYRIQLINRGLFSVIERTAFKKLEDEMNEQQIKQIAERLQEQERTHLKDYCGNVIQTDEPLTEEMATRIVKTVVEMMAEQEAK